MNKWAETGWAVRARGSRHLFSTVGAIGGFSASANIAWRGHSSSSFDLISSMHRLMPGASEQKLRSREMELLTAARDWGLGYGIGGWASDLQLLADLQHYGTATRLIDVSNNPMTALWFACQEPEPGANTDGALIALNTAGWLRFGRGMPPRSRAARDDPVGWEFEEALASGQPFVVETLVQNDRLRAQEGYFVAGAVPAAVTANSPFASIEIHPGEMTSTRFESLLTSPASTRSSANNRLPFAVVIIPADLKRRILLRLQNSYNRRPHVLFPDYAGFQQYSLHAGLQKRGSDRSEALEFFGYTP